MNRYTTKDIEALKSHIEGTDNYGFMSVPTSYLKSGTLEEEASAKSKPQEYLARFLESQMDSSYSTHPRDSYDAWGLAFFAPLKEMPLYSQESSLAGDIARWRLKIGK